MPQRPAKMNSGDSALPVTTSVRCLPLMSPLSRELA
jgi:hypothetical protein